MTLMMLLGGMGVKNQNDYVTLEYVFYKYDCMLFDVIFDLKYIIKKYELVYFHLIQSQKLEVLILASWKCLGL